MSVSVRIVAERAAERLLARGDIDLLAIAQKRRVFFHRTDSHLDIAFAAQTFASDAELRAALARGDLCALRSALVLLAAADPEAAGPIAADMLEAEASEGLSVARYGALGLFDVLAGVETSRVLGLLEREDVNAPALADALLRCRRSAEDRLALLRTIVGTTRTKASWQLAEKLWEPLAAADRERLVDVLHSAVRRAAAPWAEWAEARLSLLEDPDTLRARAARLDAPDARAAINAAIALGPDVANELLIPRFFAEATLATTKGRKGAESILHAVETRILLKKDNRWKKHAAWLALADRLAGKKTPFELVAESLAIALRGSRPAAATQGKSKERPTAKRPPRKARTK